MTNQNLSMQDPPIVPQGMLDALLPARRLVILSGAGMSAESGVPTFRDAMHGLWEQFNPEELASATGWRADRDRVWAWYEWRRGLVQQAQPNPGHLTIPRLADAIRKAAGHDVTVDVITQNVDDLHERAGTQRVAHLHGSLFAPRCFTCGKPGEFVGPPPSEPIAAIPPPKCQHCDGVLRPGVVWFGEELPNHVWRHAEQLVVECDALMVVGTSGVVYPVARLPIMARECGKWVGEINPNESDLSDKVNLHWQTTAARGLPSLIEALQKRTPTN